jgi:hypothetical protein
MRITKGGFKNRALCCVFEARKQGGESRKNGRWGLPNPGAPEEPKTHEKAASAWPHLFPGLRSEFCTCEQSGQRQPWNSPLTLSAENPGEPAEPPKSGRRRPRQNTQRRRFSLSTSPKKRQMNAHSAYHHAYKQVYKHFFMGAGENKRKITVAAHATSPLGRKSAPAHRHEALRTRPTSWARHLIDAEGSWSFGGRPRAPGRDVTKPW